MENAILNIGDMVSKYRVVRLLSICGASFIYEAEDVQLKRTVCLELFSPQFMNDELKHRILVQARTAASLSHPNICPVYEVRDVDGRLLFVREFSEGRCLSYEMGGKPLGIDLVLSYAIQISSALTAAHGAGVVFRDLKPTNILVTPSGVKLLGLGLFVPLSETVPSGEDGPSPTLLHGGSSPLDGTQVWYSTYLSPEQASEMPVDARSDLFSFGAVLYEMATGRPAFASDTARVQPIELLQRTPPAPRSLNPNLPPELEEIILKAIEKDRDLRYQKASEMSVDLQELEMKRRMPRKLDRVGGPAPGSSGAPADRSDISNWIHKLSEQRDPAAPARKESPTPGGTPASKPDPDRAGEFTQLFGAQKARREPGQEAAEVQGQTTPLATGPKEKEAGLPGATVIIGKPAQQQSAPQSPPNASTVDTEPSWEVLDRTLDLALALSVPLLTPMEILALLRLPSSKSLYELLKQDGDTDLLESVRSRGFLLEFLHDSAGRLRPVDVIMRVNAPDFEPPRIEKKVRVRPDRDCELQTFLLTPKQTGVLSVQFDVLLDDLTVASRLLKTRSHSSDRAAEPAKPVVVSMPLSVTVRPRRLWAWACGIAAIGLIAFAILFTQQQSKRSMQTSVMGRGTSLEPVQQSSEIATSGKNYALLFATDDYDYWPHLNNPLHDAHTIADELRDNYSFADPEPHVVSNPTTKEIIDILHEYAGRSYGRNDQLFIFFAGHGFFDQREQEGFLIARESKSQKDDSEHSSYLDFSRLSRILDNIPVAHIFVVIDACYGGAFDTKVTKWAGQRGAADEYADVAPEKFIRRKLALKGRLYLTSGQITTVPDGKPGQHSPFARRFIEVLRGYGGRKQLVTATSIAVDVARLEPEPRFGDFGDSAPGADFLFIPK